jgi:hypothetical protein
MNCQKSTTPTPQHQQHHFQSNMPESSLAGTANRPFQREMTVPAFHDNNDYSVISTAARPDRLKLGE